MSYGEPTLTLAEAAKACGVSVSTMRRRREELESLGASRHGASWQIPISALIALGLMPRTSPPDASPDASVKAIPVRVSDASMTREASLLEEIDRLKTALAEAEKRAAVAEAEARERLNTIEAHRMTLRMIEGPKAKTDEEPETPEVTRPREEAPRRGLFDRLLGR